jgi:hypothetical protein
VEPEEMVVARQQLSKHVPMATNTHATTEELLDAVFYVVHVIKYSICSEMKVAD